MVTNLRFLWILHRVRNLPLPQRRKMQSAEVWLYGQREMKSVGKKSTDKEEKTEMPIYVKLLIAVVLLVIILLAVLFSLLKYRQVKRRRARQLARKRKKALERRWSNTEQTGENAFRRQSSAGRRKNTKIRNRQVDDRRSGSYRRRDREGRYR